MRHRLYRLLQCVRDGGQAVCGMEHRGRGWRMNVWEMWGHDEHVRVPCLQDVNVHLLCFCR